MKKFLSLLLALTLVLSLVVVPARAAENEWAWKTEPTMTITKGNSPGENINPGTTVVKGTALTFSVNGGAVKQSADDADVNSSSYDVSYSWEGSSTGDNGSGHTASVTPSAAGEVKAKCTVTVTPKASGGASGSRAAAALTKVLEATITVSEDANTLFKNAVKSHIRYGTQTPSETSGTLTVYGYTGADWSVDAAAFGDYTDVAVDTTNTDASKLIITGKKASADVRAEFNVTIVPASFAIAATVSPVTAGGKTTLSVSNVNKKLPANVIYAWTYTHATDSSVTGTIAGAGASVTWKVDKTLKIGDYTVTCTAKDGAGEGAKTVATTTTTVNVSDSKYALTSPAIGKQLSNDSATITLTPGTSFKFYLATDTKNKTHVDGATYKYASSNRNIFTVTDAGVISVKNAGTANLTITASFQGVDYPVTVPVTVVNPTYTLGSTYCGYNNSVYNAATLVEYAKSALTTAGITGVTVGSVALANASGNVVIATGAEATGYTLTASRTYLGTADLTATVTKSGGGTFTMTFKVPVLPIPYSTSLGTVNAEPYTTGSTYYNNTYRVTLPTTFNQYYVVSKNTTPNYNVSAAPASGVTTVTLNQNDFVNGQCTLYVIAWNSNYNGYGYGYNYGKYYSGAITVTQTNYNIQYNGVAGETVQFAQSDFTDFMNEVAEARGDASKTKSYPYVTFDYVTFSLPTTAQGTLYYGGTAMSTSNSSGAFNTRTKVTNLDSVTFVPNAKTSAKTITLNFTLYATRYSSSSTSHGTTVPYSGSVVINLVREDIKYTVSQGDSVRFDESDFLSYLRSTKGYTSNYTIDYVTFDQSAVSAVNEGSLYTYYSGYNYGGSVKTTDKFYYSATASQNALSDVAFLASRYAKTGETVYIPFTIYARYGSTGTGTRQLTGTVAIKIGQTMNFIDVKTTDYFYNSVKWAVGKNITNGTSSTTFSPYKSCTRAEIVTFLWRAAGSPEPTITRNPFRDVNAVTHSSYYKAILWASQKGITSGTSATAFSPDQVCTRAQIVTFLYRYAGQPSGYYSNPFKDVGATSEASYYNAILWAVGKGITTGTSATTFSPYASCNRAEAVTFLYRYTNGL